MKSDNENLHVCEWIEYTYCNILIILAEIHVHFYASTKRQICNSALARGIALGKILRRKQYPKWILKDEVGFICEI